MPENIDLEQNLTAGLENLLEGTAAAPETALERVAELQAARAERLEQVRARLTESLGADHPRVRRHARKAARLEAIRRDVDTIQDKLRRRAPATQEEFRVTGRFLRPRGAPAAGLRVRLIDPDGKHARQLPAGETDRRGGFSLTVDMPVLERLGITELFLEARAARKIVYRSERSIKPAAGATREVQVTLEG